MELFSERYGHKAKKFLQTQDVDKELRNRLWNALDAIYWSKIVAELDSSYHNPSNPSWVRPIALQIWDGHLKRRLDSMPVQGNGFIDEMRGHFFTCSWDGIYDFLEFLVNADSGSGLREKFVNYCNNVLESEKSGYRFINFKVTPITNADEIEEIEKASESNNSLKAVAMHIDSAVDKLSDRKAPDYRNSIKESISAVEAICRLISKQEKATLGDALESIEKQGQIKFHSALKEGYKKLYGYTSDANGIRHSLLDEPDLSFEDAKYMLVSCSAFINYLKVKADNAGIAL
jgi:hypothetical protein